MDDRVEVQIGARKLIVEMPDLFPMEINVLAEKVAKRMSELQAQNVAVGDTSKIALLAALSFAADLERERQAASSTHRSGLTGLISELAAPKGDGEHFRAVLLQVNGEVIPLLIPVESIDAVCRAFVSRQRVRLTGRMVPGDGKGSFYVSEIARAV
jgi:cell division protein ZapA (FtsZ GTPase activity inhibitor)